MIINQVVLFFCLQVLSRKQKHFEAQTVKKTRSSLISREITWWVSMALLQAPLSGCHMDTLSVSVATHKKGDETQLERRKKTQKQRDKMPQNNFYSKRRDKKPQSNLLALVLLTRNPLNKTHHSIAFDTKSTMLGQWPLRELTNS